MIIFYGFFCDIPGSISNNKEFKISPSPHVFNILDEYEKIKIYIWYILPNLLHILFLVLNQQQNKTDPSLKTMTGLGVLTFTLEPVFFLLNFFFSRQCRYATKKVYFQSWGLKLSHTVEVSPRYSVILLIDDFPFSYSLCCAWYCQTHSVQQYIRYWFCFRRITINHQRKRQNK